MTPAQSTAGFTPLASVATTAALAPVQTTPALTHQPETHQPEPHQPETHQPETVVQPFVHQAFEPMARSGGYPTSSPTNPPNHVPDFGSIPVPEDVAAAVRRAITAIEAATMTSTSSAQVTFGPMHVTGAGRPTPFSFGDQSVQAVQPDSNGHPLGVATVTATESAPSDPMNAFSSLDAATPINASGMNGSRLNGSGTNGLTEQQPLGQSPNQMLDNPQAAAISGDRRGALRRLIDGIRRR